MPRINHTQSCSQDFLEHASIIAMLNDPNLVQTVVFKKRDGTFISEEEAIAEDDKFDPTAPPVTPSRKRSFPVPTNSGSSGSGSSEKPDKSGDSEATSKRGKGK